MKKHLFAAILVIALFSTASCGASEKTCQDVANVISACLTKLSVAPDANIKASCDATVCNDKRKTIYCIVGTQCPASAEVYDTALKACGRAGGCQ